MSDHYKIMVIGSGPAGFTAGLYASRANLSTAILEGSQPGGQLTTTTEVENYPGFADGIQGPEMMEILRKQANRFGAKSIFETVTEVDLSERPFKMKTDAGNEFISDAIIIATGATARKLENVKGYDQYWGRGISACATCDGFFYKGQKIVVIGGGDSAMEEANYLTHFGDKVYLVHRRKEFRASAIMVERARKNEKIEFILDSVLEEFKGEEVNGFPKLTSVVLKNLVSGETAEIEAGGAFFAIGHIPNTELFKGVLDMDEEKYLITKPDSTYTNVPGVFAAGDVKDKVYRQAVTAAGSGCQAAIDAERWLAEQA